MKIKNYQLGALYEAEFEAESLRRNFVPNRPTYPVSWDFLVDCPKGLLKVQVKGTSFMGTDKSYKIMASTGSRVKKPIGDEVDILACWIDPVRCWYIIPTSIKPTVTIRLFASTNRSSSKYEKYRENWSPFYAHG